MAVRLHDQCGNWFVESAGTTSDAVCSNTLKCRGQLLGVRPYYNMAMATGDSTSRHFVCSTVKHGSSDGCFIDCCCTNE